MFPNYEKGSFETLLLDLISWKYSVEKPTTQLKEVGCISATIVGAQFGIFDGLFVLKDILCMYFQERNSSARYMAYTACEFIIIAVDYTHHKKLTVQ